MRGYQTHVSCSTCVRWWKIGDTKKYDPITYRCKNCNRCVRTNNRYLIEKESKKNLKRY